MLIAPCAEVVPNVPTWSRLAVAACRCGSSPSPISQAWRPRRVTLCSERAARGGFLADVAATRRNGYAYMLPAA